MCYLLGVIRLKTINKNDKTNHQVFCATVSKGERKKSKIWILNQILFGEESAKYMPKDNLEWTNIPHKKNFKCIIDI